MDEQFKLFPAAASSAVTSSSVSTRPHLDEFFAKVDPVRNRLIFAIDATASRQPTWDRAAKLTAQMFDAAAAIGGLDIQLVLFRGAAECVASRWLSDARSLTAIMSGVMCRSGETQIGKILIHARKENERKRVAALVLISDACEELPTILYTEARRLGDVPVLLFQEGNDERVGEIYAEIAGVTGGAVAKFDLGAAGRLEDLLKAVAAFAAGGVKALAAQNSEAATLLLTQLKKRDSPCRSSAQTTGCANAAARRC
ncbi:VWA domain-containing protein [Bradyrhizobium sp. DASA03120]|uniref:VWA domain-containing protein n=1 Tax=Bradyrhizobium sp. SMVTL-02 TaxID=3395917 RepID=UPI003F7131BA